MFPGVMPKRDLQASLFFALSTCKKVAMIERVQIKLKQMYGAYSVVGETNELNKRKQNLNNLGERIDFSTNGAGITEYSHGKQ